MYRQNVKIRESELSTESEVAEYLQLLVEVFIQLHFITHF